MGSCFAQLTYGDATTSVHGCAESLPEDDRAICNEEGDITKAKKATAEDEWPILMCCRDDMCNYMESLDMNLYVSTKSNGSILKGQYWHAYYKMLVVFLLKKNTQEQSGVFKFIWAFLLGLHFYPHWVLKWHCLT